MKKIKGWLNRIKLSYMEISKTLLLNYYFCINDNVKGGRLCKINLEDNLTNLNE